MLSILSATKSFVVCVKPIGVASQGEDAAAMPALLAAQLGGEVYPVHRLDQAVGGVMVYARTQKMAAALTAAIGDNRLQKQYLAVLCGIPSENAGTLEDLLFHDRVKNKTYVVKRKRAGVKAAKLDYQVLATFSEFSQPLSLVKVTLHTGRTHQIRVQFASRGLPLLGDGKYGSKENHCTVALWSYRFSFPDEAGKIQTFCCLPPDTFPWSRFPVLSPDKKG